MQVFENSEAYQTWLDKAKSDPKSMPDLGNGIIAIPEHYHTKEDMKEGFIDRADKAGNYDTASKEEAKYVIRNLESQYERGISNRLPDEDKHLWRQFAHKMLLDPDSKDYKEILRELYEEFEAVKPENEFVPKKQRAAMADGTYKEPKVEEEDVFDFIPKSKKKKSTTKL